MIDRAIKSRCRATDRGTLGADRRPSAVGRRRSRRGLMQPCTTPRGAIRPQLLVMSRPEAFRGALLRPLLAYRNRSLTAMPHDNADTMTTEIDEDGFRWPERARRGRPHGLIPRNYRRFPGIRRDWGERASVLCKSRDIFCGARSDHLSSWR